MLGLASSGRPLAGRPGAPARAPRGVLPARQRPPARWAVHRTAVAARAARRQAPAPAPAPAGWSTASRAGPPVAVPHREARTALTVERGQPVARTAAPAEPGL